MRPDAGGPGAAGATTTRLSAPSNRSATIPRGRAGQAPHRPHRAWIEGHHRDRAGIGSRRLAVRCSSSALPPPWGLSSMTSGTRPSITSSSSARVGIRSSVPTIAAALTSARVLSRTGPVALVRRSRVSSWKTTTSPSAVSWTSHSIAKPRSIAASAAESVFSIRPAALSWKPRWAIGRSVSQPARHSLAQRDLGDRLDLDGDAEGQGSHADGRTRVLADARRRGPR